MNLEEQKKGGLGGLVVLFLLYLVVGIPVSVIYIFLVDALTEIYLCFFAAIAYGAIMGNFIVKVCKKRLRLSNTTGVLLVVVLGIAVLTYFKWNLFFALHDCRYYFWEANLDFDIFLDYEIFFAVFKDCLAAPGEFIGGLQWFNEVGTWSYGENPTQNVAGMLLTVIWLGEFAILAYPSISACFAKTTPKAAPLPNDILTVSAEGETLSVIDATVGGNAVLPVVDATAEGNAAFDDGGITAQPIPAFDDQNDTMAEISDIDEVLSDIAAPVSEAAPYTQADEDVYKSIADDEKDIYN